MCGWICGEDVDNNELPEIIMAMLIIRCIYTEQLQSFTGWLDDDDDDDDNDDDDDDNKNNKMEMLMLLMVMVLMLYWYKIYLNILSYYNQLYKPKLDMISPHFSKK